MASNNLRAAMKQCFSAPSLRAYVAEFVSTFLFVFTAVGSAISARMLNPEGTPDVSALVATSVAQALGLYAAVFIAADVSGGHVNPAVTFAFAIGGHIPVPNAIFYWASQMLGSTFACLVLNCLSAGLGTYYITVASVSSLPPHAMSNFPSFFVSRKHGYTSVLCACDAVPITRIATLMTGFGASILEGIMTFVLVYAVHVAGDPRRAAACGRRLAAAATAPVAGMVTGACVLAFSLSVLLLCSSCNSAATVFQFFSQQPLHLKQLQNSLPRPVEDGAHALRGRDSRAVDRHDIPHISPPKGPDWAGQKDEAIGARVGRPA
ncbi:hypothetical protein EJB05_38468, partial [Eragrostis curvula]